MAFLGNVECSEDLKVLPRLVLMSMLNRGLKPR